MDDKTALDIIEKHYYHQDEKVVAAIRHAVYAKLLTQAEIQQKLEVKKPPEKKDFGRHENIIPKSTGYLLFFVFLFVGFGIFVKIVFSEIAQSIAPARQDTEYLPPEIIETEYYQGSFQLDDFRGKRCYAVNIITQQGSSFSATDEITYLPFHEIHYGSGTFFIHFKFYRSKEDLAAGKEVFSMPYAYEVVQTYDTYYYGDVFIYPVTVEKDEEES